MSSVPRRIQDFVETTRGAVLALLLVYAAAVLLNLALTGTTIYGPTHFDDEVRYWITARALHAGTFKIGRAHV